ncbi:hypothetical protein E2C01_061680 [Portunus trituberculatus]|uniref:Uncharacterized protein n=1 Tax=Portunus trituberculatus TaxID=210409 RepID=A0A5B7HBM6_PORTR|nr:hypothetical protein [Portunus trituberculatus]
MKQFFNPNWIHIPTPSVMCVSLLGGSCSFSRWQEPEHRFAICSLPPMPATFTFWSVAELILLKSIELANTNYTTIKIRCRGAQINHQY